MKVALGGMAPDAALVVAVIETDEGYMVGLQIGRIRFSLDQEAARTVAGSLVTAADTLDTPAALAFAPRLDARVATADALRGLQTRQQRKD